MACLTRSYQVCRALHPTPYILSDYVANPEFVVFNALDPPMTLIHHVVTGAGDPPLVFVHGFGCSLSDWAAQTAHFSPRHRTVAVDLRGHGKSPGEAAECSVERYGADVAEVMRALALPPAIVIGHSMGCRVAVEAALQAPAHTAGVILVDGSQFAAAMEPMLRERFVSQASYEANTSAMFDDMFTARSDRTLVAAALRRALALPRPIGEKMMLDMLRYDVGRLSASLGSLRVPVLAVQTTGMNEKRERTSLRQGQSTPYLDMLRRQVPAAQVRIIEATGHFPQLDEPAATNAAIQDFLQMSRSG